MSSSPDRLLAILGLRLDMQPVLCAPSDAVPQVPRRLLANRLNAVLTLESCLTPYRLCFRRQIPRLPTTGAAPGVLTESNRLQVRASALPVRADMQTQERRPQGCLVYGFIVHASPPQAALSTGDRKSTRLNSSHSQISYAVFCLKKKQQ